MEQAQKAPPPFTVPNRNRAEKLVNLLYGPLGRTWINRHPLDNPSAEYLTVQVGTESGSNKKVVSSGLDFTAALRTPVLSYIKGASSYEDTKERIKQVSIALGFKGSCAEFVEEALSQFPTEYAAFKDSKLREDQVRFNKLAKQAESLRESPQPA